MKRKVFGTEEKNKMTMPSVYKVCEHQNLHIAKYATDSSLAEFPIFKECLYSLTATVLHFWLQLHFLAVAFLWMGGFYGICFLLVTCL